MDCCLIFTIPTVKKIKQQVHLLNQSHVHIVQKMKGMIHFGVSMIYLVGCFMSFVLCNYGSTYFSILHKLNAIGERMLQWKQRICWTVQPVKIHLPVIL